MKAGNAAARALASCCDLPPGAAAERCATLAGELERALAS